MARHTFSIRERLIASNLWMPCWLVSLLSLSIFWLLETVDFSVAALRSPAFVLLILFAVPATLLLASIVSPFLAFVIFDDLVQRQERQNGGPFSVGDRVVVIPGRNSGREATVTSLGQCNSLRITMDGDLEETGGYSGHQLKRIE